MKKTVLLMAFVATSVVMVAQSEFQQLMLSSISSLYQGFGTGNLQEPITKLERLAQMDSTRWEPHYYAAYGYCMMSLKSKEDAQKDVLADQAQAELDKALRVAPQESELYVMQGFVYNMKLLVSPMMRGQQYMGLIHAAYSRAEALDSLNPRTYYMRAQMIEGTPAFMGGGKDKAQPQYVKAKQKFDTFTSSNPLAPRWGKDDCARKVLEGQAK